MNMIKYYAVVGLIALFGEIIYHNNIFIIAITFSLSFILGSANSR